MIIGAKYAVVPFEEVCVFLIEEMEFGEEEAVEVSKHQGGGGLFFRWEVGPVELDADSAIMVIVAEVQGEGGGVGEG